MTFKAIIPALFISALWLAPASAVTPAKDLAEAANASVIQVQGHRHRGRHMQPRGPHRGPHFVPGRRYGSAPHGWRRYGARPGDWRTRGCVMVGPLWFCP